MKWMEGATEGIVVAGDHGEGNALTQLSGPQGLIVDHLGTIYVAYCKNHRIMRWCKGTRQGNFYVADHYNHRIQRFNIDRN